MGVLESVIGDIWRSPSMIEDLDALCSFGGRLAGSEGERKAHAYLRDQLAAIPGVTVSEHAFEYQGWERELARLTILGNVPRERPCHSLLWSPDTPKGGLEGEVVDLGRGTLEAFEAHRERIKGRIVLVRHEFPFGSDTIHRMRKYMWARERGAAGFLIANCVPGEMTVTGFAADATPKDIPGLGVSLETGAAIAAMGPAARVRMEVKGTWRKMTTSNLIADVKGRGSEWVVLGAHYDGHDLGQSALDNATGAAAAVQILRSMAPHLANLPRSLRIMLFTAEEWGLHGSKVWVDEQTPEVRRSIALEVQLDTIAGSPNITCLSSEFPELAEMAESIARRIGTPIKVIRPIKRNSDHYNFARRGIPALRLVAGFDEPECDVRYLLMAADTRDKVRVSEFKNGAAIAAEFVWCGLTRTGPIARHKTDEEMKPLLKGLE
ncbi:MAG: M28 family peptidase [Alphaproteobacteria bacterium]